MDSIEKQLNENAKMIRVALALRRPQIEALYCFQKICDILPFTKNPDMEECLSKMRNEFPTLTSFERGFPSVCFALATGIGKTRLMGALIAYLCYEKGVRNFFVMAPNLTIYNKLKNDMGNSSCDKYVFAGLDKFAISPRIIDGDNYEYVGQGSVFRDFDIVINVFNISKLNSETGRMRRLNEVLGQSYFDYLKSLPDLCVLMDESHHYHADRAFDAINELNPILGAELTATPQIQKGSRKIAFKNVVYEYSLASALKDGLYVKIPAVVTVRDFRPEEYTAEELDRKKLVDGVAVHEKARSDLDLYARNYAKPFIKPFVLVVAKDMEHSRRILEFIKSNDFYGGYYKDKVLEINSSMRGAEKDENIELLLSLENPNNKIEIVIHVNMLKEGWDVTNLYTIIPLRASASETLTEQTIGRGLRLPYGQRTKKEEIDRLSIISHDKYEAIINLAKDPNSIIQRVSYIEDQVPEAGAAMETVELVSSYDDAIYNLDFVKQLKIVFDETVGDLEVPQDIKSDTTNEILDFITRYTASTVTELSKQVKTFDAVRDESTMQTVQSSVIGETMRKFPTLALTTEKLEPVVDMVLKTCVQTLTDKIIPIPVCVVEPYAVKECGFRHFRLDTRNLTWHPTGDTYIGTELTEDGKTFEFGVERGTHKDRDSLENSIMRHIIVHDNVDYRTSGELIYSLINDAKEHFMTYLSQVEAEKVMSDRKQSLADIIYVQMNEHFYREEIGYIAREVRPFCKIETEFGCKFKSDDIYDLRANIQQQQISQKIFNGFQKACHTMYKFDSNTERIFATVLENDASVLKWMRPAPRQFSIYYGVGSINKYEPDFIVETSDIIYMAEVKAARDMNTENVYEKARAAIKYCESATLWNKDIGGKPWEYILLPHDEVRLNSSFKYLAKYAKSQMQLVFPT